jgi:hypothetical protein
MIILWIRKNKKAKQEKNTKEETTTFRVHDEVMKKFHDSHPNFDVITDKDILTGDGNLLAPVNAVKLSEHVQN